MGLKRLLIAATGLEDFGWRAIGPRRSSVQWCDCREYPLPERHRAAVSILVARAYLEAARQCVRAEPPLPRIPGPTGRACGGCRARRSRMQSSRRDLRFPTNTARSELAPFPPGTQSAWTCRYPVRPQEQCMIPASGAPGRQALVKTSSALPLGRSLRTLACWRPSVADKRQQDRSYL